MAHTSLLPPNQGFVAILLSMVPLATLGAVLVNWDNTWSGRETINSFCTGLSMTLSVLGITELLWSALLQSNAPSLQLCVLLLVAALGATIGTTPGVSKLIIQQCIWALQRMRLLVFAATVLTGGVLGFFLTSGLDFGWLTPLSILLGIGVAVALILPLDRALQGP